MSNEKIKKVVTTGPPVSGLFSPHQNNLIEAKITENSEEDYERCTQCGYCRQVCRVYNTTYSEKDYAGGRNRILRSLARKEIPFNTETITDSVYRCMLCGNCRTVCPVGIDTVNVFRTFRKRAVDKGVMPSKLKATRDNIMAHNNPFAEEATDRFKWCHSNACDEGLVAYERGVELYRKLEAGEIKPEDVSENLVGYFVGCTSAYRNNELVSATCRVLDLMGVEFIVFPDEKCCGSVLFRTGLDDDGLECVKFNLDMIRKTGIKHIIFSCSGCYSTFNHEYNAFAKNNLGFSIEHMVQFAPRYAKEKNLKIVYTPRSKEDPLVITYHDPCHLGRYCDVYDEPRELINMIEGIKLIEMKHNKDMSWCCGAGGGVRALYGEISGDIASNRLDETVACWEDINEDRILEALETKAEALVSGCVFCKNNLALAASTGSKIEVTDISQILEQCEIKRSM